MAIGIRSFRESMKVRKPQESAQQESPVQSEADDPLAKLRVFVADKSWLKQVNRLVAEANQASSRAQNVIARRCVVERNRIQLTRDGSDPDVQIRELSTQIRAAEVEVKKKKAKARELVDEKIAGLAPASQGIWAVVRSKKQQAMEAVEKLQQMFSDSASDMSQNIATVDRVVEGYNSLAGDVWDRANELVSKTGGPALAIRRPEMRFTRRIGFAKEVQAFVEKAIAALR